jgi:hypothetical protein
MKEYEETHILHQIAQGVNDIDTLEAMSFVQKRQIRRFVLSLIKNGMINAKNGLTVSKKGLVELSKRLANQESPKHRYNFWSAEGPPYFVHYSKLRRDVISHPNLFFDPANSYPYDSSQFVYKTSIPDVDFDLEDLEILYNLLYESDYLHPTGFWLLKSSQKRLCGWGIANLKETLKLVPTPSSLKFLCAFTHFIVLAASDPRGKEFARLNVKIYITRDVFPYVDTLDLIYDKLRILLNFHGVRELPKGDEFKIPEASDWRDILEVRPRFVPKVQGKILDVHTDLPRNPIPFVIIMTPSNTKTSLNRISPWFVTCPGGCIESDFAAKKQHYVHFFQALSLPEIDVLTLMISA